MAYEGNGFQIQGSMTGRYSSNSIESAWDKFYYMIEDKRKYYQRKLRDSRTRTEIFNVIDPNDKIHAIKVWPGGFHDTRDVLDHMSRVERQQLDESRKAYEKEQKKEERLYNITQAKRALELNPYDEKARQKLKELGQQQVPTPLEELRKEKKAWLSDALSLNFKRPSDRKQEITFTAPKNYIKGIRPQDLISMIAKGADYEKKRAQAISENLFE